MMVMYWPPFPTCNDHSNYCKSNNAYLFVCPSPYPSTNIEDMRYPLEWRGLHGVDIR